MSYNESKNSSENKKRYSYLFFICFTIIYTVFFGFLFIIARYFLRAGILIGSIYVFVAFYYFYEQFLVPYSKERKVDNDLHLKDTSTVYSPNIYIWMMQWFLPAITLQLFVILGFYIALLSFPLYGNIFMSPYQYGQIYKTFNSYRQSEINLTNNLKDFTVEEIRSGIEDNDAILLSKFGKYIKKEKKYNLKKRLFKDGFYKLPLISLLYNDKASELRQNPQSDPNTQENGFSADPNMQKISSVTDSNMQGISSEKLEFYIYIIPFMIAFAFGFLGSLIYSLKDTTYRFYTLDLYPKTYINYIIRFIFAPSLCIVIAYFMMNDWPINSMPIVFFLIGFFPQRAMQFIEDKTTEILKLKKEEKKGISLSHIQGMTDYIAYRFRELGIDDVQNLANVDLTYLRRNLAYSNRLLSDFVSQALFILHFSADLDKFRAFGIRDVISFKTTVNKHNCGNIAKLMNISPEVLLGFLTLIETEEMKVRINTLNKLKCETNLEEQTQMRSEIRCR